MGDPKYIYIYIFSDEGVHHVDGYLILEDEPLRILRGKDIGALNAIVDYIERLEDQLPRTPIIESHLESAYERLVAFYRYQHDNKDLQSVGCSRRSHVDSLFFMERAKQAIKRLAKKK